MSGLYDLKNSTKDNISNPLYDNTGHTCEYISESDLSVKMNNISHNYFSVLSLNIRSLSGNWNKLQNFLPTFGKSPPSIICLQEIWHSPQLENFKLENYHPFKFASRANTGRGVGGGVGLYVSEGLHFETLKELSIFLPRIFESLFIKIKLASNKFLIVGNIYRPNTQPYEDMQKSNKILNEILLKIKTDKQYSSAKDVILAGDFNINLLKHSTHPTTGAYLDLLLENGFLPLITLPTRIQNSSASLLDHIATNISDTRYDANVIITDISDHFPLLYIRHLEGKKNDKPFLVKKRMINDKSKQKFLRLLEIQPWDNILNDFNPVSAFDNLFSYIDTCFEESFPEKECLCSPKNKQYVPWMTSGLLTSRKRKLKLFHKKLKNPSEENKLKFKMYNSLYTQLLRKSRKLHYDNIFKSYSNDCKKTWLVINDLLGRKKSYNDIPDSFESKGKSLSGPIEIAEGFNDFFANIGPNLAKEIPISKTNYLNYLSNPCRENFIFANVLPSTIETALQNLKGKNSAGIDKISTNLLKFMTPTIITPLTHVLNLSFKSGYIPTYLKTAVVKPIFKKGKMDQFTNYRPISLLSSFSKLLEKIAAIQIMKYLNKFKLLYRHQYGFRSGHNTTQPVIQFLDKIFKALNNPVQNELSLGIFIDLTKAFDTCDTEILLNKLQHYGFRGVAQNWFRSYLTGRQQCTSIKGKLSNLLELTCGVPQGSILGPILFLILINDLPNASNFFTILFADDTTLQMSGSDPQSLFNEANIELCKLADWFKANKLTLNVSKTKYIIFRDKSNTTDFSDLNLFIDKENIDRIGMDCNENSFKFVGLHLDEFLSWNKHAESVRKKISSATFALAKLKKTLPSHIKYTIYNSLFRSHIEFGISAWGNSSSNDIKRICSLQKRAIRYISNANYNSHTGAIFKKFNILKFHDLFKLNQAMFMHKYIAGKLPLSFDNLFTKLNSFERSMSFQIVSVKKSHLRLLPSFSLPKNWNDLPLNLKRLTTPSSLKRKYTQILTEDYDTPCANKNCFVCRSNI